MDTDTPATVRRSERENATISISLVKQADNFRVDEGAITTDISLCGMGVRTALALLPGEWVGVVARGEFPHAIPARVVWVRADELGSWTLAGLEFLTAYPA